MLFYNLPWCLVSDFNTIPYDSEKTRGGPIKTTSASKFSCCMNNN